MLMIVAPGALVVQARQDRRILPLNPAAVYSRAVVAAGYVYVATIRPRDTSEGSTIAGQTRDVLEQLSETLQAAGSSMGQLCSVTVTLSSASNFAAMNEAYAQVFPDAPPARTTVVAWMSRNVKIELAAIAVPNGARREVLQPARWAKNPRPYSYIVKTDDLVFFSGLVSRRGVDDTPVTGTVKVQTDTILENAEELLTTAGLTFDDVVATRVYLTSPYDFEDMNEVYGDTFDRAAPARATAVVDLMSPDSDVELTFTTSQQPKVVVGGAAIGIPASAAIQAGPRVWLSGVIGDTDKHPKDVAAQTRDIFDRMKRTLGLAGLTYADVVDTTVYLRDSAAWPDVDGVFKNIFPSDPPARNSTVARLPVEPSLASVLLTAVKK
jgi:2-iminobutanoate/2-iminopropanoate deaminase